MLFVTEAQNGQTLPLTLGETLNLQLPENATTGYRWAIDQYDAEALELITTTAQYPTEPMGSAGEINFDFQSKQTGLTQIHLKYWRHWEGDASVTQRFTLGIDVQPPKKSG